MADKNNSAFLDAQKALFTRGFEAVWNDVTKNLETELKRRDIKHAAELESKDEKYRIITSRYNDEIVKNSHLIDEKNRLQCQLDKLNQKRPTPVPNAAAGTPKPSAIKSSEAEKEATIPREEYLHLTKKFEELSKHYKEAVRHIKYLETENASGREKFYQMRASVLEWQKYADRHREKREIAKAQPQPTPGPSKAPNKPDSSNDHQTKIRRLQDLFPRQSEEQLRDALLTSNWDCDAARKLLIRKEEDGKGGVTNTVEHQTPAYPSPQSALTRRTPGSMTSLDMSSPAPPGLYLPTKSSLLNELPAAALRGQRQSITRLLHPIEPAPNEHESEAFPARHGAVQQHPSRDVEMANAADCSAFPEEQADAVDVSKFPDENTTAGERMSSSQTTDDETQVDMPPPSKPQAVQNAEERVSSSQTTDDDETQPEEEMLPPSKPQEHTDDEPEVVSARSLKRKRSGPRASHLHEHGPRSDGTPSKPFRIKEEPGSSPPPQPVPSLQRDETEDLDDPNITMLRTPQLQRYRDAMQANNFPTLRTHRSSSAPLVKEEAVEVRRHNATPAHDLISADPRANSEPSEQRRQAARPLREMNANARMGTHNNTVTPRRRLAEKDEALIEKFQMLTESGEEPPPMDHLRRLDPASARKNANKRLKAARNLETPAKSTAKTPTTAPSRLGGAEFVTPTTVSKRPFAPSLGGNDLRNSAQSEPRTMLQRTTKRGIQPGPTIPLRQRPVSELKLSDFKANPKYNQGYSFAFAETVRKRADRACLTGCTRPECCGSQFRALAATLPALKPREEESLLQDFLGDAYEEYQMTQMSREERQELILQARTKQLANKHGKHRNAYERPKSPPGYWRVDFPTTQEENDDRKKADEMEKEMVKERRAEAMRKGGRWIFRDELKT